MRDDAIERAKVKVLMETKDSKILVKLIQKFPEITSTYEKLLEELTEEIHKLNMKIDRRREKNDRVFYERLIATYNALTDSNLKITDDITEDVVEEVNDFNLRVLPHIAPKSGIKVLMKRYHNIFIVDVKGHTVYTSEDKGNKYQPEEYYLATYSDISNESMLIPNINFFMVYYSGLFKKIKEDTRIEDVIEAIKKDSPK